MRLALVLACACGFRPAPSPVSSDASHDVAIDTPVDADASAPGVLAGQRWLLPCTSGNLGNHNCSCAAPQTQMVTVPGDGSQHYTVTIRIRGAMEQITYANGNGGAGWYVGGSTSDTGDNIYSMHVSSPAQTYYLNNGTPGCTCSTRYDYMATFPLDGGATVTVLATGQDTLQWGNYDSTFTPITFAGVTTTPSPYDGQFAQLDVVAVERL